MIELSMIRDLVAIFGVIAGFSYYVLTVRATRKNQQLQLQTRQTQVCLQLGSLYLNVETQENYIEMLHWTWTDYSDFEHKYGSDDNPRLFAIRNTLWASFNMIGKVANEGVIDLDYVDALFFEGIIWQWFKFKDIIYHQREVYFTPDFMADWEQLANKLMEIKKERYPDYSVPLEYDKYTPEQ